jgi:hypothetical protein
MDKLLPGPLLSVALCGVASIALLAFVAPSFRDRSKYPNGPMPLGMLGTVSTLLRLQSDPDKELLRLRERWGNICMLWFGSGPVIIINTPKAAKELLNDVGSFRLQQVLVRGADG